MLWDLYIPHTLAKESAFFRILYRQIYDIWASPLRCALWRSHRCLSWQWNRLPKAEDFSSLFNIVLAKFASVDVFLVNPEDSCGALRWNSCVFLQKVCSLCLCFSKVGGWDVAWLPGQQDVALFKAAAAIFKHSDLRVFQHCQPDDLTPAPWMHHDCQLELVPIPEVWLQQPAVCSSWIPKTVQLAQLESDDIYCHWYYHTMAIAGFLWSGLLYLGLLSFITTESKDLISPGRGALCRVVSEERVVGLVLRQERAFSSVQAASRCLLYLLCSWGSSLAWWRLWRQQQDASLAEDDAFRKAPKCLWPQGRDGETQLIR